MSYEARVFRILIASPSDVEEEREIAVSSIQAWNDLYSASRKTVLLPLRWETHTAPTYGTRPQEVINKAIVDECDLLVGIFWTRIGSPTGVADSGTLEEIERTGKAGKPVMLYFSNVEIDPDKIDLQQIDRLKIFKRNTYPEGLVENFKSRNEFRDKFARQLEMKVRELQDENQLLKNSLNIVLMSSIDGALLGSNIVFEHKTKSVRDFAVVPAENIDEIRKLVNLEIIKKATIPIIIGIENISSTGMRNLYIQLEFISNNSDGSLSDMPPISANKWSRYILSSKMMTLYADEDDSRQQLDQIFNEYEPDRLQKTAEGWKILLEWDALQPQRLRIIKPFLFFTTLHDCEFSIRCRIYTESSPEPYELSAKMNIITEKDQISLDEFLPTWREHVVPEVKNTQNKKRNRS